MFGIGEGEDRAIFPIINKTGENLVLIPADRFVVVATTDKNIILKLLPEPR